MFIPIKDDAPTYRKPYVTIGLIVLNSLVFLYSYSLGFEGFQIFTVQYGFIPYEIIHMHELTPQYSSPIIFTIFSSMFMHGGWMHLIGNMLFLWIYGNNIEDYFGPIKFLLFYLLSGIAAVALFTLFGPNSQVPMIGASGAVAGVMGGYLILHPRARITVLMIFIFIQFFHIPAKILLIFWFVKELFMAVTSSSTGGGVAFMAHVGGFAFGWLVLKLIVKIKGNDGSPPNRQRVYRMQW